MEEKQKMHNEQKIKNNTAAQADSHSHACQGSEGRN